MLFYFFFFFFNDTATTEIYTVPYTLSLHDALPISRFATQVAAQPGCRFSASRLQPACSRLASSDVATTATSLKAGCKTAQTPPRSTPPRRICPSPEDATRVAVQPGCRFSASRLQPACSRLASSDVATTATCLKAGCKAAQTAAASCEWSCS